MKSWKILTLLSAILAITHSQPAYSVDVAEPVTAETRPDGKGAMVQKVAFVDLVKIVNEAKAAKSIESQVEKLKAKYQADAKSKESALKAREKELAEQKKAISAEAFQKKLNEFRQRIQNDQEQVMNYQKILQTAYVKALDALKVETVKASGIYARDNNISLVMPKSQLLYAYEAYDITDAVLKLLDEKVPEIKITVDEKAEKPKADKKAKEEKKK